MPVPNDRVLMYSVLRRREERERESEKQIYADRVHNPFPAGNNWDILRRDTSFGPVGS